MDRLWYRQLGARIARVRVRQKLTQESLAEKAGIAPSYVARIEVGARRPSLDVLGAIADALKIQLPVLVLDERSAARAGEPSTPWDKSNRALVIAAAELDDRDLRILVDLAMRLRG